MTACWSALLVAVLAVPLGAIARVEALSGFSRHAEVGMTIVIGPFTDDVSSPRAEPIAVRGACEARCALDVGRACDEP